MQLSRYRLLAAAALALLIGLAIQAVRPASAGPDVSGSWSVRYALACSASLTQSGSDVTGSAECGGSILLDLTGSLDAATGRFVLSGDFEGVAVTIEGTLSDGGSSATGTVSAPPLVPLGLFSGAREGKPSLDDMTGLWLINVHDIFSGTCTVELDQDGTAIAGALDCQDGPSGTFSGTFDLASELLLSGPFGDFGAMEMRVSVSGDGDSFTGIWRLLDDGPSGVVEGERSAAPAPREEQTPAAATATPPADLTLPPTGTGAGPAAQTAWVVGAAVGALLLGVTSLLALRRRR